MAHFDVQQSRSTLVGETQRAFVVGARSDLVQVPIIMIICVVPVFFLFASQGDGSLPDFPLTVTYIAIGVFSLIGYAFAAAQDGFSLRSVFYFFCFVFFFVVPFFSYAFDLWKYGVRPIYALAGNSMILAWMILFQTAYMMQSWRARKRARKASSSRLSFRVKVLPSVGFLLILIGIAISIAIVAGPETLLYRASRGGVVVSGTKATFLLFSYVFKPAALFLFLLWLYKRLTSQRWPLSYSIILWSIGAFAILMNLPSSAARFYIFAVYIAIMCWWRPPRPGHGVFYTLVLVAGIYASSIFDVFRDAFVLSNLNISFSWKYLFVGHFDAYEIFVHGIGFVEQVGVTWGRQLLGILLFWVPRAIWPDKPIDTGGWIAEEYLGQLVGLEHFNKGAPLIAEAFINYHAFGVVVTAWFLGLVSGHLDERWRLVWLLMRTEIPSARRQIMSATSPDILVLYPLLIGLFLFVQRGSMMSAFAYTTGMATTYYIVRACIVRRTVPITRATGAPGN